MNRFAIHLTSAILFFTLQRVAGQPLSFEKLTTQNGLSNNKVNGLLQDKRGFIWIGTEDGLNRYDGHEFTIFRNNPDELHGLSGNIITGLLMDKQEVLWIATADGGLTRYDYRLPFAQQFKRYKHLQSDPASIPGNIINAIAEDRFGFIWLAMSGNGILRFNKKTERFKKITYKGVQTCLALTLRNDTLWAGMQGSGILTINTRTLKATADERYSNAYLKLPHVVVTSLFTDKRKNVWFGSWDNVLYRYNASSGKEEKLADIVADEATAFAEDPAGKLWIGSKSAGLIVYDQARKKTTRYTHQPLKEGSLIQNKVNCIYRSRDGIVWIGTDKGINTYNPYRQQFVQQFLPMKANLNQNSRVYDFYRDGSGTLWIGTTQGLFKHKSGDSSFTHIPLKYKGIPLSVTKIYRANNASLYLGTDYSVFTFDAIKNSVSPLPDAANDVVMKRIIASRIQSITDFSINGKPVLLTSPYGHFLTYYDYEGQKWVSRADSQAAIISTWQLKDNLIQGFYKSTAGKLWMATARQGLGEWTELPKPHFIYHVNDPLKYTSISNNNVYAIAEAPGGNLWISTYGGGLNEYDPSSRVFKHQAGPANLLQGIAVAKTGDVWMVSNGNLQRYNPAKQETRTFELPDAENTGGIGGNIYQDGGGTLYVGGSNYFISFMPGTVTEPKASPKPVFTDFLLFDRYRNELLFQKEIRLAYNQNFFTIKFSSPGFNAAHAGYRYMLQGLDDDWRNAGSSTTAGYTNLPPGEYVFNVKQAGPIKNGAADIASLTITVAPPFWQRWWFYILAAALVGGLAYSAYRYRINELLKRQAIRNKIARDLHDNVGSTLSSISIYSQVAQIKKAEHKTVELDGLLQKISAVSNEMVSEMNDIVWAINPLNDGLDKIVARIEAFAKPLLRANNIDFHMHTDPLLQGIEPGMERSKELYLIMKEAIHNCIKHAAARNLYLTLKRDQHRMIISIRDDGHGFTPGSNGTSLSGNGLMNIINRVDAIHGKLNMVSDSGGTLIEIEMKLK